MFVFFISFIDMYRILGLNTFILFLIHTWDLGAFLYSRVNSVGCLCSDVQPVFQMTVKRNS